MSNTQGDAIAALAIVRSARAGAGIFAKPTAVATRLMMAAALQLAPMIRARVGGPTPAIEAEVLDDIAAQFRAILAAILAQPPVEW